MTNLVFFTIDFVDGVLPLRIDQSTWRTFAPIAAKLLADMISIFSLVRLRPSGLYSMS